MTKLDGKTLDLAAENTEYRSRLSSGCLER